MSTLCRVEKLHGFSFSLLCMLVTSLLEYIRIFSSQCTCNIYIVQSSHVQERIILWTASLSLIYTYGTMLTQTPLHFSAIFLLQIRNSWAISHKLLASLCFFFCLSFFIVNILIQSYLSHVDWWYFFKHLSFY